MATVKDGNTAASSLSTPGPFLRSAGIVGLSTALSRVLGFARDWLIAVFYGTSPVAQAFVVAFRLPNLLRDLIGEGAANTAFVPVLSRTRTLEGRDSWLTLIQAVWVRLLVLLLAVSAVGVVIAPDLVRIVAPGFRSDPELLSLAVTLTRILFPFVGLVGMAAFFMGLLNSVHHFMLPSLGPAVLNLCMIAGIFLWTVQARGLACGVVVGGILQLVIQLPAIRREGIRFRLRWENHPGVGEIKRLLIPRTLGSAVYQLSALVDTMFASFSQWVGAGGIAALYFAHRFLHLPLALFGISMAQAALPTLAAQAAMEDAAGVRRTVWLALRTSLFIAVPSSIGLFVLAHPIIRSLLQHGEFSSQSTTLTVAALQWYVVGLSSLCAGKVLVNTLYAFGDTWTPVRSSAMALGLNVLLNLLLIRPMGLGGLALATSLSSTWNALHLYRNVRGRIGSPPEEFRSAMVRVLGAALGMGLFVHSLGSLGSGAGWLLLTVTAGAVSFFGLAYLLRVEEVKQFLSWSWARCCRKN